MPNPTPRLAFTLGDPAGIGPEIVLTALQDPWVRSHCVPVVYGNARLLARVAAASGKPWPPPDLTTIHAPLFERPAGDKAWLVDFPMPEAERVIPGQVQAVGGRCAHDWIQAAARDAMHKRVDAIVTAPINKAALHLAGIAYPGHTELLQQATGAREAVMMFWSPSLIVSLATIHHPLSEIPGLLSRERILAAIRLTATALRASGIARPRIGVLALNPHGGEQGLFGNEEASVILPAIHAAQAEGLNAAGPLVPDTAFLWLNPASASMPPPYDAYIAMYHDQGLIPFKMAAFDQGVNVTLGLPIIRTSPDHGTAMDLAWQGRASAGSFLAAIRCALRLAIGH